MPDEVMTVDERIKRVDRYLLGGAALVGLALPSPIGLAMILYGLHLESQERKAGNITRPAVITAIALFGMANGLVELFSAHGMLFASNNPIFQPLVKVYGIFIDERYWAYGFNTEWWGGPSDKYEATWNLTTGFLLFPFYTVAHYGLYRMKRWGYQYTLVFSWIFAYGCMHYAINHTLFANENQWTAVYPIWGWIVVNYPYNITPFIAVCILSVANRNMFSLDSEEKTVTTT
jgi:hypothetical protein